MKKRFISLKKGWELFRSFRRQFAVVLVLLAVVEILALAAPYLLGKVLNSIQANKTFEETLVLAGLMMAVAFVSVGISYFKDAYELRHVDFSINAHLTDKTLTKILGLSIGQHRSQNSGITQSVVNQGQSSLEQMLFLILYTVLPLVVSITVTLAMLVWFNLLIGSVVLFGTALYVLIAFSDNLKFWPKVKGLIDLSHKTRRFYTELLRTTSLVQVNSQEERVRGEHKSRVHTMVEKGQEVWLKYAFRAIRKSIVTVLIRFSALAIGIYLVYKRNYLLGDLVIIISWTNQATSQLWMIGRLQRQWLDLWAQVKKYFAILDVEPDIVVVANPIKPDRLDGRVEFKNVSFTYPEKRYIELDDEEVVKAQPSQWPALVDVSFRINAGERVAFVGESGAGKSTLINLLVRGYDPDHGQILVDGHDLRLVDLHYFRQSIGLVEQNVVLFDHTLKYNILFGMNGRGASITDADLEKVSHVSCIDRFNHRLTSGWETHIGENGVKLSGGERQRVGIARAIIKEPRILILDEATSSLDAVNESLIKEAVRSASVGRTTIIIAHRLSTVRDADKIFVMDKGSIVAEGRHEELVRSSPEYKELVTKQLFAV